MTADIFNVRYRIGANAIYRGRHTTTLSEAFELGGEAVVLIEGVDGRVAISDLDMGEGEG